MDLIERGVTDNDILKYVPLSIYTEVQSEQILAMYPLGTAYDMRQWLNYTIYGFEAFYLILFSSIPSPLCNQIFGCAQNKLLFVWTC